ncbi:unnamed protein product [Rhizophagus irregularis]|uniref:Uncharacterized protein n=1 Tax=Rhizophagus irregularis TaxID=588596 RepID=A0A915ZCI5_9GLOM|nr:unnamed protein product [Rhizophagus irregularis]CAB5193215.1 unnamed protein product [Rhizophagus irregularis]CAB5369398.1 unnamed protein product [Rhizophagus irregularis]
MKLYTSTPYEPNTSLTQPTPPDRIILKKFNTCHIRISPQQERFQISLMPRHVHQMLSPMSDNETSDKCKHSKSTIIDENDMPTSGSKRMSDYHLPSPLHK